MAHCSIEPPRPFHLAVAYETRRCGRKHKCMTASHILVVNVFQLIDTTIDFFEQVLQIPKTESVRRYIGVELLLAILLQKQIAKGDKLRQVVFVFEPSKVFICSRLVVYIANVGIANVDAAFEGGAIDELRQQTSSAVLGFTEPNGYSL